MRQVKHYNAHKKPTSKQLSYLKSLMKKANQSCDDEWLSDLDRTSVSSMISMLKESLEDLPDPDT